MGCQHKHGDTINGMWVCGQCYRKLDERPKEYRMVEFDGFEGEDGGSSRLRQIVIPAPISTSEHGETLSQFVTWMALRLMARGGFTKYDAIDYAIGILQTCGDEFGDNDCNWSRSGAYEYVDEDMSYWDDDGADTNG